MTGYGMAEKHTADYSVKVEVRSLNGKYLDLNMRMPRFLMPKEIELRNFFGRLIERGSATVSINVVKHRVNESEVQINSALATQYYNKLKQLSEDLDAPQHDIFRITTLMQDVIYQDEDKVEEDMIKLVKEVGEEALNQYDNFRKKEGNGVLPLLKEYCQNIESALPQISAFEGDRIEAVKQRLYKNLEQLLEDDKFDKNRFEQELIYYLEKLDISEEKTRLAAHCAHFTESLEKKPKGKTLNFIAQEMGREINTLGSKANHSAIQKEVVVMKEELEKIKEQVLNIL